MANTWTPNEKQTKVINFLKEHKGEKFTLAQIAKGVNDDIKTGTSNVLVAKGLILCHKNELEIVCELCGHKHKVSTYEIA